MSLRMVTLSDIKNVVRCDMENKERLHDKFFGVLRDGTMLSCIVVPKNKINNSIRRACKREVRIVKKLHGEKCNKNLLPLVCVIYDPSGRGFGYLHVKICLQSVLNFMTRISHLQKRDLIFKTNGRISKGEWDLLSKDDMKRHLIEQRFSSQLLAKTRVFEHTTVKDSSVFTRFQLSFLFRLNIAASIASALGYLHSSDELRPSIRASVVFIDKDCKAKLRFHPSFRLPKALQTKNRQKALQWTAPEVLNNRNYNAKKADVYYNAKKADIYSLGAFFWQLETNLLPYGNRHRSFHAMEILVKRGLLKYISQDEREVLRARSYLSTLVKRCCHNKPMQRPKASTVHKLIIDEIKNMTLRAKEATLDVEKSTPQKSLQFSTAAEIYQFGDEPAKRSKEVQAIDSNIRYNEEDCRRFDYGPGNRYTKEELQRFDETHRTSWPTVDYPSADDGSSN